MSSTLHLLVLPGVKRSPLSMEKRGALPTLTKVQIFPLPLYASVLNENTSVYLGANTITGKKEQQFV